MKRSTTPTFRQTLTRAFIVLAVLAVALVPLKIASAETLGEKITNLQAQIDASQA